MKITLLAINAKYVHSSLAVWYLAGGIHHHDVSVTEATINQNMNDIVERVVENSPELIGISTYIWNAGKLPDFLKKLRDRLPETVIVLGGPEATHNAEHWLTAADYVLGGEAEHTFPSLIDAINKNCPEALDNIPGLCFLKDGTARTNRPAESAGEYVSPYSGEYYRELGGRIAYIETSRGCPFSCAYCLSGGSGIRFFPMDEMKKQIYKLTKSGTRTIKFVDRTFNCNAERAYAMLEYIVGLDTECCFHIEAAADLFDERTLAVLNSAPIGRIQVEIGIQSFNRKTLDIVSRKTDLKKAETNIKKLLSSQNIHVHVDLIAGLPYETLPIFEESFNRAYAIGAHTLQLGFLKLLHGSKLREQAESLGITYKKEPPYEIISSSWLDENEFGILKQTENAIQHTYNKGRFLSALEYVLDASKLQPFELFRGLGRAVFNHATPLEKYAERIYGYFSGRSNVDGNELRDRMICDLLGMTKGENMPAFLRSGGEKRKQVIITASRLLGRAIASHEASVLSSGKGVYVDSTGRDAVTGLYKLHFID